MHNINKRHNGLISDHVKCHSSSKLINENDSIGGFGEELVHSNKQDVLNDLSKESISLYLNDQLNSENILVYQTIDSTNLQARKLALADAPHGTVILAEHQTHGKGRMGRKFSSPAKTGIYMSVILRPKDTIKNSLLITVAAAVCIYEAIKTVTNIETEIKWVNDIYLNNRKIGGILTEAASNFENGEVEYIVLGIGINVSTPKHEFPMELREIAGSLAFFNKEINRNHLVAEMINNVMAVSENLTDRTFMETYKQRSCVIGKSVKIISRQPQSIVKAIDINEDGALVVEDEFGMKMLLNSGEISIRPLGNDK